MPPERSTRWGSIALALVAGFALALVTSGGSSKSASRRGGPPLASRSTRSRCWRRSCRSWSCAGAVRRARAFFSPRRAARSPIAAIHVALKLHWVDSPPWLAERPEQWVNDGVAVFSTLAIVWACARKLDLRLLVVALVMVTIYKVTGHFWHLDAPPGGFASPCKTS